MEWESSRGSNKGQGGRELGGVKDLAWKEVTGEKLVQSL